MKTNAFIFDIQSASVHDGPGQRTTIFLSGCPLNCPWCCNPEGLTPQKKVLYSDSKCKFCLKCIDNCKHDGVQCRNNHLEFKREICDSICEDFSCLNKCYQEALSISGQDFNLTEFKKIVNRDRHFWGQEGGVTFSGGEPLLWTDFLDEILDYCEEKYIHTAIETTSYVSYQKFIKVIPRFDFIFFDIKHMNFEKHKKMVGVDNRLILENIKRFRSEFSDYKGRIVIRVPLIPTFNDDDENLSDLIKFMKENLLNEVNFLPLHHLAKSKYEKMNKDYPFKEYEGKKMSNEKLKIISDTFSKAGISYYYSNQTPF